MENVVETRQDLRVIRDYFAMALFNYRQSNRDASYFLDLIRVWEIVVPESQPIIARKMLAAIGRQGVDSPVVVRAVLRVVGTDLCQRPNKEVWQAIAPYCDETHLLSVNLEAMAAAERLLQQQPSVDCQEYVEACRLCAWRHVSHADPTAVMISKKLLIRIG